MRRRHSPRFFSVSIYGARPAELLITVWYETPA